MSDETAVPEVYEPRTGEARGSVAEPLRGRVAEPLRGRDPELLDEDPLLEEQPYSVLEDDDDFPVAGLDSSSGAGSW